MKKIKLSKINRFNIIFLIMFLLFFAVKISAETTFFDSSNNAFIMGYTITSKGVEETSVNEGVDSKRCLTSWVCTSWSSCINEIQTRNCTKEKEYCYADVKKKPLENQSCSVNQLFDIKFELENAIIRNSNELSSIISFESFGNVSTLVDLTYKILDYDGKEVYIEKGSTAVTTEQIVRKNFENLNLPKGKYTLVLTTVYGDNIKDEFKQEFEITRLRRGITGMVIDFVSESSKWYGFGVIALIIIFIIIYKLYKQRDNYA